jgi:hypothetical protein
MHWRFFGVPQLMWPAVCTDVLFGAVQTEAPLVTSKPDTCVL